MIFEQSLVIQRSKGNVTYCDWQWMRTRLKGTVIEATTGKCKISERDMRGKQDDPVQRLKAI